MRTLNRVVAVSVALTIAAGGFVVAAEIVLAGIGRGPWVLPYDDWYDRARANHWSSPGPRWLFIALCLAGLAVLALQVIKAAPRSVPLGAGRSDAGLSRRTLERSLARRVGRIEGVSAAKAAIDQGRARIVVDTNRGTGDLRAPVEEVVRDRLGRAGLAHPLNIVVAVNKRAR